MNSRTALAHLRIGLAAARTEACQIFDGAEGSRHAFMAERAGLEAMRQVIAGGPRLVGESISKEILASP